MNRILVWDWPVRVLHWAFAGSLTAALIIGFTVDDEHPIFAYHMLLGLAAGFFLILRLVLGIVGSRYARFTSWAWSPKELVRYVGSLFTRNASRHLSHNPASTWISVVMFGLVALLIATGIVAGKRFEDLHGALAVALASAIGLHLLGLAWHSWRFRENISRSMIDGRKVGPPESALASPHRIAGVVVAIVACAGTVALFRGFDASAGRVRLPLVGAEISLGDNHESHDRREIKRERRHD
jgi:cytochrome b